MSRSRRGVESLRDVLLSMEQLRKAMESGFDESRGAAAEVIGEDYFGSYS